MSLTLVTALRRSKPRRDVLIISGGNTWAASLNKNGVFFGWGLNGGSIGDNSTITRPTPVSVAGQRKTFCKIATTQASSFGIDKNGQLWSWGSAGNGILATNTLTAFRTPVSIAGQKKTFCEIGAANCGNHAVAIDRYGRLWSWGRNTSSQLGDNTTTDRCTPVSVLGAVKTFCKIAFRLGSVHSLAIDKDGKAWGWGSNTTGQLGDGTGAPGAVRRTPVSVYGNKTFCEISCGGVYSSAIDKNGQVWAWGTNSSFQLGDGSSISRATPVSIAGQKKTFCKISNGNAHSLAIDRYGTLWSWGNNNQFQLGAGLDNTGARSTPILVAGSKKTFCAIDAGWYTTGLANFSLAVDKNGRAWTWGIVSGFSGGNNFIGNYSTPVSLGGQKKTFCKITFTLAIDKDGQAWGWGTNVSGRIGNNSTIRRLTPVSIAGQRKTFCEIVSVGNAIAAIDKYGQAWGWGRNNEGQLGINSTITSCLTPVSVAGQKKTFCTIISFNLGTLALDKYNKAWTWGSNTDGLLGANSTVASERTPVSVYGNKTFCQISGSGFHGVALDNYGIIWSWGRNAEGQLGNNTTILSYRTPISLSGPRRTFCKIIAGTNYTQAIDKDGQIWSWGGNSQGWLGDNSTINKRSPVSLVGQKKTFCQLYFTSAGGKALDKNNILWGWGNNNQFQVGDLTILSRLTPVIVSIFSNYKSFKDIKYSHFLDKNNTIWGWSTVNAGILGNNEDTCYATPIRICNI